MVPSNNGHAQGFWHAPYTHSSPLVACPAMIRDFQVESVLSVMVFPWLSMPLPKHEIMAVTGLLDWQSLLGGHAHIAMTFLPLCINLVMSYLTIYPARDGSITLTVALYPFTNTAMRPLQAISIIMCWGLDSAVTSCQNTVWLFVGMSGCNIHNGFHCWQ